MSSSRRAPSLVSPGWQLAERARLHRLSHQHHLTHPAASVHVAVQLRASVENVEIISRRGEREAADGRGHDRSLQVPGDGDKMTTRISQKGVIGKMMWAKDMLRTCRWDRPRLHRQPGVNHFPASPSVSVRDVPHASGMIKGERIDATPFNEKKLVKYVNDAKASMLTGDRR